MNSLIPIGALKRDEIYSFIGGFFIACSWYVYFASLSCDTSISGIDLVTNPMFLITWLLSTALLFTIQLLISFIIAQAITYWLKRKTQMEIKKILNLHDPVEDFVSVEFVNEVKIGVHLVGIIMTSVLLSLFPLHRLSSSFVTQKISCVILLLIASVYMWLLFIFVKFWKMLIAILLLKSDGSLEIIDQNTYSQKRAAYIANVKNEQSKQKLQEYLEQQERRE